MSHTSALPGVCADAYMGSDCDGPGAASTVIALTEPAPSLWCRPDMTRQGDRKRVAWQ